MFYSTEIHNSAEGFDHLLSAVQKFNPNRFMYALQYKNWNETDIEKMAHNVAEYRERLEHEYDRLVTFAKQFNKEFVTNDNKRYATALVMLRKLRSGISETKRIFAKFCPRSRRRSIVRALCDKPQSAYDHAYISMDTYQLPLFSLDNYPPSISRMYNEMERFFFTLVRCIQLCKQVLEEEQGIKKDGKYCKFLYDEFRGNVLREIADIIKLIPRDSAQLSDKNNSAIASRSLCANDEEWAPMGFHSYTKTDVKLLIIRQVLDEEKESVLTKEEILLFGKDEERVLRLRNIIRRFDTFLPAGYRRKNLPAKYIQMFFQYVGIEFRLESDALNYFNAQYLQGDGNTHTTVSYQAVNSYKKEVLRDEDGAYKAFVKRVEECISTRSEMK